MNQNKPTGLSDQEMLTDALSSQKFITDNYNLFANECASPAVKSEFINILNEEHHPAQQEQINQAKQKYTQMKP